MYSTTININLRDLQEKLVKELEAAINKGFSLKNGPFITALNASLQEFKVATQAYYGGTFVGNHVHKCLQVKNNHLLPYTASQTSAFLLSSQRIWISCATRWSRQHSSWHPRKLLSRLK